MGPLLRYSLLQIPGIAVLAVLLHALWTRGWLGGDLVLLIMALWLIKDVVLYPLYRGALRGPAPYGPDLLIGRTGRARTAVDAGGLIVIDGEFWRARSVDGRTIPAGTTVVIRAVQGRMLLIAQADTGAEAA